MFEKQKIRIISYMSRFFLLGFVCLSFTGCQWLPQGTGAASQQHYSQYQEGLRLFQQKKYKQALGVFLKLQSQAPDQLELMYNLGTVYLRLARTADKKDEKRKTYLNKAEKHLKAVIQAGNAYMQQKAHYNLGLVHTERRQYEQALVHFASAVNIAEQTIKTPDPDAEHNRQQLSMLIRQRERQQQKLNRTRVFRYAPKVIKLTASKAYDDPVREIALRGTFTHKTTGKSYTVWGYPVSRQQWEIRFVPPRTGKWTYEIKSIAHRLPGMKKPTQVDKSLQDKGLFRVLPSARAGKLVVASGNAVRFAWKKPKEEVKTKVKAKKSGKSPKAPQPKKKKKSPIPEDETIVRWSGLHIPELFTNKLSDKLFTKHHQMLELVAPSAIYVDLPLDKLFQWQDNKPLKVQEKAIKTLVKRLQVLRQNPTYKWVLVYVLRSEETLTQTQLFHALGYLLARLAHVDAVWSAHELEGKLRDQAVSFLRQYDPYQQPIAVAYDPALAERIDKGPTTQKAQKQAQTATTLPSAPTKQAKQGKGKQPQVKPPTLFKPNPKYRHLVWHTSHHIATGDAIQTALMRPWIGDVPLPMELEPEALLRQWWKLYIAGISTTVVLDRAFHEDELDTLIRWQRKALDEDKLPPHPDDVKASTSKPGTAPSTRPAAQAAPPSRTAPPAGRKATTPTPGLNKTKPRAVAQAPGRRAPSRRPALRLTPKEQQISRPYLHFLRVRHNWHQFLDSFRFSGYVRPSMVRTMVPDLTALRKWQQQQQQKRMQLPGVQLSPPGARNSQKPDKFQLSPPSQRGTSKKLSTGQPVQAAPELKRPSVQWKTVSVRGFLASNGPTVLFVPPSAKFKQAPRIHWRNSRWDLEFRWYNASTGKFLDKKIFRQVTSLALTAPKKPAHVAKVTVRDHKLNAPYKVLLPAKLLQQATTRPVNTLALRLQGWKLVVQPPKPPPAQGQGQGQKQPPLAQQHVSFIRTERGYEARFLPNRQGIWSFTVYHKGKKLKGIWRFPGKIKVVPSALPAPLQRQQRNPMRLMANNRPYFMFTRAVPNLLSESWSDEQFAQTIKQLPQRYPGTTTLVAVLPELSWTQTPSNQATTRPKKAPKAATTMWSPTLAAQLKRLDQRIKAIHEAGYHLAISVTPQQSLQLLQGGTSHLEYLMDRYAMAYPLLWVVDRSGKQAGTSFFPMLARAWYIRRYPKIQRALAQAKGKQKPQIKERPAVPPPLVGAHVGRPRSEKQLKQAAKQFDWLWMDIASLQKEVQDFKLTQLGRPIVLTWRPLLKKVSPFVATQTAPGKAGKWNKRMLHRWAGFLWRAQMIGFGHAARPLNDPLVAPKKTKKNAKAKLPPAQQLAGVLRGFFQTFDWNMLRPPARTVQFQPHEAFSAETPIRVQPGQKGKKAKVQMPQGGHHVVAWVNPTVRQYLEIKRSPQIPLNKHRYIWINPLTGEQPVSPQLLPPKPAKGQRDRLQVPFRPAVLYVYRRPPQRGRQQQRPRRRKQQKEQDASKRQQVRNQLRNLPDNRQNLKRKRQQRRSLTGKRG